MAINIYSILAMASEPEKIFFRVKNPLSDNQLSLIIGTIQAMQCFKSWFCGELFTTGDINEVILNLIS